MKKHSLLLPALLALALLVPAEAAAQAVTLIGNFYEGRTTPGVFSFKSTNAAKLSGTSLTTLKQDEHMKANYGGATVGNRMHFIYADTEYAALGFLQTVDYVYDINTWQLIAATNFQSEYVVATCTAVDPVSGKVYGQFLDNRLENAIIGITDYDTYQTQKLGDAQRRYVAMGMTSKQQLFAIGADGVLYELSTTDGSERRIGSTGISLGASPSVQSAAVDSRTDIFYWAATESTGNGQSNLYTVDLATGAVTLQTRLQNRASVALLRVEEVSDGAPAQISDLAISPIGATTQANVTFTLPATTFAGGALSGTVSYEVLSGGATLTSGSGEAGTPVSLTVTLPQGVQTVAVSVSNAQGKGKTAAQEVFVGLDVPNAVRNMQVAVDGSQVIVSWDAATGVHGGYVGTATYDVVRQPGNVSVATGTDATTVTDVVSELRSYSYSVVVHAEGGSSDAVSTYDVVAGPPLQLPYVADFATESPFSLFTILNPDDDTFFWDYDNDVHALVFNNEFDPGLSTTPDDWAITPPLQLSAGETYVLSLRANVGGEYASVGVDQTAITYGRSPSASAQTGTVAATQEFRNRQAQDFSYEFAVPDDGAYYIGLHNVSAKLRAALAISSIAVRAKSDAAVQSLRADDAPAPVFSLDGRRVADSLGAPLRPGIYVSAGRKVILRR